MADAANTWYLAQKLRRSAAETELPEYALLMLRAAEELECFVRLKDVPASSQSKRSTAA